MKLFLVALFYPFIVALLLVLWSFEIGYSWGEKCHY